MKLLVNIALSLAMLAACLWLVWPDPTAKKELSEVFSNLRMAEFAPYLFGYIGLLAVTHFCRAWRWNNLLAPIGATLSRGRLLAISSVGFMAILALPARLGEFVRPALIRDKGKVSASAALGTVAVERIVDGLLVSLFIFVAFFTLRDSPFAKSWMMPTAWASLGVFSAALTFLVFALLNPEKTVRVSVAMSLAPKISPKLAKLLSDKLHKLIEGFLVLKDAKNLTIFTLWSIAYWVANGVGMWLLAQGFGLDLSVFGAFAVMGLVAVGISLPNSPGLVGQFQWLTVLGLSLFFPQSEAKAAGLAYAIVLHGIQVVWYVGIGALAIATPYVSFAEVVASRSLGEDSPHGDPEKAS